jgi:predicted nucleotidyltransferase
LEIIKARKSVIDRVVSEAKRWASSLSIRCTAYLIGSYARGDFNLWSDIDILLVSDDLVGSLSKETLRRGVVLRDDLNLSMLQHQP